jgi:hypothetical protein
MALDPLLQKRYDAEGINPETKAFALINGEVYLTVAGMEIKAMRSGILAGKDPVTFSFDTQDITSPHDTHTRKTPVSAVATYHRLIIDVPRAFSSDPVQFSEYARKRWHYEMPFMFLAKIARACALRHAFPDIFAGVVSYEEAQSELNFTDQPVKSSTQPVLVSNIIEGVLSQGQKQSLNRAEITNRTDIPDTPPSVSSLVASVFNNPHLPEGRG